MKRWIALSLGLAIAAAAAYSLLSGHHPSPPTPQSTGRQESTAHAPIDEASRRQLEELLRQADLEEARER
jgi:hypothetical protein